MADRIILGAGSHEPIYHRLRTGHASADEWRRWERESSRENLDTLQQMGVNRIRVACTKGFGLEVEKPLIERAARMREACAGRGMECDIYVQGLPVYYETFLLECPEAEAWMARMSDGSFYPWGGQTFRRWMDQYSPEFLEYERSLIRYAVQTVRPRCVFIDNTVPPGISYTLRSVEAFRNYLREKFADLDPLGLFGISRYDKVDLPRYDPVYWPADAYRIVKDPILQEVCHWQAHTQHWWCDQIRQVVKQVLPGAIYVISCGCDTLRYNALMHPGVNYHKSITVADMTSQEESGWRPRVVLEQGTSQHRTITDGRSPDADQASSAASIRVSTDARWTKILGNYGRRTGLNFWGEFQQVDQEIAAAHGMVFAADPCDFGTIGPLAAHPDVVRHLRPAIAWAGAHMDMLGGRDQRYCQAAVWRSTATTGFVRHTPVWAACVLEQMLFENHLPFAILLDENLDEWLKGSRVLVLPMSSCVSDAQVERITSFVHDGGRLLLIGDAGTRDQRTRVREKHAFAPLLPTRILEQIEQIGPPHFVPEVNISALREVIRGEYGRGRISLVPRMPSVRPLDLTRDPYSPFRMVCAQDIVPPANESEIWQEILWLMDGSPLRVDAPRHALCEYWCCGNDLLVACVNLHPHADGGPLTLHLPVVRDVPGQVLQWLRPETHSVTICDGKLRVPTVPRLVFIRIPRLVPLLSGTLL